MLMRWYYYSKQRVSVAHAHKKQQLMPNELRFDVLKPAISLHRCKFSDNPTQNFISYIQSLTWNGTIPPSFSGQSMENWQIFTRKGHITTNLHQTAHIVRLLLRWLAGKDNPTAEAMQPTAYFRSTIPWKSWNDEKFPTVSRVLCSSLISRKAVDRWRDLLKDVTMFSGEGWFKIALHVKVFVEPGQ